MTSVEPLGRGLDHVALLVDGALVVRVSLEESASARAEATRREAGLLELVGDLLEISVPRPVRVAPAEGLMTYRLLPGVPLDSVAPDRRAARARLLGAAVGGVIGALARVPVDRAESFADRDDDSPQEWREEAAAAVAGLGETIPSERRRAVRAFLAATPPAAAPRAVLCHDDLGMEHVLVDDRLSVVGVIDWSDAAITDPAGDLGLVLRDLGPAALEAALGPAGAASDPALPERTRYRARCSVLEDLAYGLDDDRPLYVDKALAALPWLFPGRS